MDEDAQPLRVTCSSARLSSWRKRFSLQFEALFFFQFMSLVSQPPTNHFLIGPGTVHPSRPQHPRLDVSLLYLYSWSVDWDSFTIANSPGEDGSNGLKTSGQTEAWDEETTLLGKPLEKKTSSSHHPLRLRDIISASMPMFWPCSLQRTQCPLFLPSI